MTSRSLPAAAFPALGLVLAAGVLLAACSGGGTTARDEPADGPVVIPEGEYAVTSVEEGGEPRPLVEGSEIRMRFRDGTLNVHAGCNHLFGDYVLAGDELTVGQIGGTEMGCAPALMRQDDWLADVLARPITVAQAPLTLTAGDVVLTLELLAPNSSPVPDPDQPTSDGPEGVTVP